jgi:transglutaminase-like putative cysteine protease
MPVSSFYRVEHETRYAYEAAVLTSQHVAYLRPRELPRQRVAWHDVTVEPGPAEWSRRVDYFGNAVDQFTVLKPHTVLSVRGHSLVERLDTVSTLDPELSPAWEDVRDALLFRKGAPAAEALQFAFPSPYIAPDPGFLEFALASFPPRRPLLEAAIDLMNRIHAGFRFDPTATTITTPVSRVLAERRGVCQDFAHLQISCMRAMGLSARYVSGYLLTDPPPGRPRLVGADASHAWLSVHCPRHGWVDLDPTNKLVPDLRHVTVAWGRDYGDVSPLWGVILGGASHTLRVGVSVIPLDPAEWERVRAAAIAAA